MSKARALFVTLIYNGVVFALAYGVLLVPVYGVTRDAMVVYTLLMMAIPFFAAFVFRRYITMLFLFLLAHAGMLALVVWLADGLLVKIFFGVFTLLLCVYSIVKRLKNEKEDMGVGFLSTALIALAGLRIMAGYLGFEPLYPVYPLLAGLVMVSGIVFIHITSIDSSLKIITQTTQQPVTHILSFNNKMLAGFVVLLAVAALGSRYFHIDDAIRLMGGLLLALIRFLVGFLSGEDSGETEMEEVMEGGGGADYSFLFGYEAKATPAIWVILEMILKYLVFIGLIALVVVGIGYVCYRIYKQFYQSGGGEAGGDEKAFIAPPLETSSMLTGRIRDFLPFFGGLPRERVRRLFYRTVSRHMAKGVDIEASDTAGEIAAKMRQAENIDILEKQYEEARYGP